MPFCNQCGRVIQQGTYCSDCLPYVTQQGRRPAPQYAQPQYPQQQYAQTPKKKSFIKVFIAILVVIVGAGICAGILMSADKEPTKEEQLQLSSKDMYFSLNGETYQLPMQFSEMLDNDFAYSEAIKYIDIGEEEYVTLEGDEAEPGDFIGVLEENRMAVVWLMNTGKNTVKLEDCEVVGVRLNYGYSLSEAVGTTEPSVSMTSDYDDVIEVFGEPDYEISGDVTELCYVEENGLMIFAFNENDIYPTLIAEGNESYDLALEYYKGA